MLPATVTPCPGRPVRPPEHIPLRWSLSLLHPQRLLLSQNFPGSAHPGSFVKRRTSRLTPQVTPDSLLRLPRPLRSWARSSQPRGAACPRQPTASAAVRAPRDPLPWRQAHPFPSSLLRGPARPAVRPGPPRPSEPQPSAAADPGPMTFPHICGQQWQMPHVLRPSVGISGGTGPVWQVGRLRHAHC